MIHYTPSVPASLFSIRRGSQIKRSLFPSGEAEYNLFWHKLGRIQIPLSRTIGFSDFLVEKPLAKQQSVVAGIWVSPWQRTNLLRNIITQYLLHKVKSEQVPCRDMRPTWNKLRRTPNVKTQDVEDFRPERSLSHPWLESFSYPSGRRIWEFMPKLLSISCTVCCIKL